MKTYNHNVSRRIVDFAKKYQAATINMEDLAKFGQTKDKEFVLRNWSYYELQQMVSYKAEREGIKVKFIQPAYTSQTCHVCGERGERISQKEFQCTNPNCTEHGKIILADYNAAKNISKK